MDANSGKIYSGEELDERGVGATERARLVAIPPDAVKRVCFLPRRQRRLWADLVQRGFDAEEALRMVQAPPDALAR